MNCTCPYCENENAYHNGINYECPDCENEWSNTGIRLTDEYEDEMEDEEFELLSNLDEPFFKLKHGKLYKCKVDFFNTSKDEYDTEICYIIPLAFKEGKNQFWILNDAKNFLDKYPKAVKDFEKMDFLTIWNDGIRSYFDDGYIMPLTSLCVTTENGNIVESVGSFMSKFEEII